MMKGIRMLFSLPPSTSTKGLLLCSFLLLLSACQQTEEKFQHAENTPEKPLYLQVLDGLHNSDAAIAPTPDVFPVHTVYNREAIIPPMCYTRTESKHNPCYVCHQNEITGRENVMNDKDLQAAYSFSDLGMTNHWKNLFSDRSLKVAAISDKAISQWVKEDNYSELEERLKKHNFAGYIPDLKNLQEGAAAFDAEGFAKDGSHWVAFSYKPFPSTFWPTNGATDDVMIRLPAVYRNDRSGNYSRDVYKANLAIVEANIKGMTDIGVADIDERHIGKDLNDDDQLGIINKITRLGSYVGAAEEHFKEASIYPQHTEFLHTVRYLDITEDGEITHSKRLKEVRYMKKWQAYPKFTLAQYYLMESWEKEAGNLPGYTFLQDHGLDNGMGWSVQGFIENKRGRLRVNTFEENLFCMGCHNSVGSTIDKTFSFARKVDGAEGWGYINLKGMPDAPNMGETQGEIATYLQRVGGGSEFRHNEEMLARWFNPDGSANLEKIQQHDVYTLITPSKGRALALNKAYKILVDEQSFLFGRDPIITPPHNVYAEISNQDSPTLAEEFQYDWDIRLDWSQARLLSGH